MTDRLIRLTTALAVLMAVGAAAVISCQHAYEFVTTHGETGLALWSLGAGIVATLGANLAYGLGHSPVGALVSAWRALALVGSFELMMLLIRKLHQADHPQAPPGRRRARRPASGRFSATRAARRGRAGAGRGQGARPVS